MFENLVNIYDDFTKNERTQSLSRFALEEGFVFNKKEPFGEQDTVLRNFKIFSQKGVKRFLGITTIPIREGLEGEIRFYDYLKTKDLETRSTSIIEVYIPNSDPTSFRLKPKSALGKLFKLTFGDSVEKRFDKKFKRIPLFELSDESMQILLEFPKITVECYDNIYLFYRKNKQLEISEVLEYVEFAEDFISSFKGRSQDDFV